MKGIETGVLTGQVPELAAQVVEAGGSVDEAARQPIPSPFDTWSQGIGLFEANMRFLHQRLSGK